MVAELFVARSFNQKWFGKVEVFLKGDQLWF